MSRSFILRSAPSPHQRRGGAACVLLALSLLLASCASGGVLDKGLELVGLKKPELPPELESELQKIELQRKVTLRIHAGQLLNTDTAGRPLSLVARIYKLRSISQFNQATYAMFTAAGADKPAFSEDVVSVQEVVLTPGQKYEVIETLPTSTTHLAVVALFRAPDSQRWRFVFETRAAAKTGLTLGAHACAMSVSQGEPVGVQPETLRLAGVQCR
jgi:type VI secretion system protein VasD